jgi:hypothetical protein
MRILLDHNTPAPLRYWLIGHDVQTAYERVGLNNGELLRRAETDGFDALITTDKVIGISRTSRDATSQLL